MRNIKLTISYDGTNYGGWQIQKNAPTIQGEIEKAIKKIFKKKIRLMGAGRTDAGVHAKAQVANFKATSKMPVEKIHLALNNNIPKDISIIKAEGAPLKFHSQYDAKLKTYRYSILNSRFEDPFLIKYTHRIPYRLSLSSMRRESRALLGRHDFKSFQASDKKERSSVRAIKALDISKNGSLIHIDIEANGFLYNMARNIVGTLIEIGRGRFKKGSMKKILKAKSRKSSGPTAPAKGLTLINVNY